MGEHKIHLKPPEAKVSQVVANEAATFICSIMFNLAELNEPLVSDSDNSLHIIYENQDLGNDCIIEEHGANQFDQSEHTLFDNNDGESDDMLLTSLEQSRIQKQEVNSIKNNILFALSKKKLLFNELKKLYLKY